MSERAESSGTAFWGDTDDTEALQRCRTLVNTIDDGIYQLDAEDRFVAVNDVIVELTGYAREELLGKHVSALLDDEDVSTVEREIERLRTNATKRSKLLDLTVQTAAGERLPCEIRVNLLEADDTVRGTVGTVREITEQKRSDQASSEREQDLRETKERLQLALESAEMGVWELDLQTEDAPVHSPQHDRIFGYEEPLDDWSFERFLNHVYPDDREWVEESFEDAFETGDWEFECRIVRADDEQRWIRAEGAFSSDGDGGPDRVVGIVQDITERKETQEALREREQHLSTLVETTPECIKVVDADGTLLQMNPAGLDMVQAESASSVVGECVYDLIVPEHRQEFREFNERICRGESGTLEFDIIGLEGKRRHMESHAAPLRRPDGTVSQLALTRDITERKERERKIEESNERLEQFAYAASHDLQEPLRMVSSYLQMIDRRYSDELDEDGEEFIDFAVDGAERMRDMIEGLLKYSRVDTRGNSFEPVDLNTVLADVREDLQVRIDETDADVTADSLPRVEGDEGQLRQLFQNLLDNAIEYSGNDPPQMHVSADRNGDRWMISVRDEGIGIDPDDADRIFEIFQSMHTNDEHSGTGIGLTLCERIVERHGGDIWVDSDPGEGTTFSFTLPAGGEHSE